MGGVGGGGSLGDHVGGSACQWAAPEAVAVGAASC